MKIKRKKRIIIRVFFGINCFSFDCVNNIVDEVFFFVLFDFLFLCVFLNCYFLYEYKLFYFKIFKVVLGWILWNKEGERFFKEEYLGGC